MWFKMKNEWRVPLTILIFSSLIFTTLTLAVGFRINRVTGEVEINSNETWAYDPMEIEWGAHWKGYCILGFYFALGAFSWAWFDFMKWEKSRKKEPVYWEK
jgi:hypothetical protein